MTLNGFLDWMDAVRPSPWSHEQKAVWVNDLESALWSQMLLAPAGMWRAKTAAEDGEKPLLLPDSWRRLYAAYVGAMMDFAAGEAGAYANSMALYNGYLSELGAWYGDRFGPAGNPPRWRTAAVITGESLGEGNLCGCVLPRGCAVLAAELRVLEAFGSGVALRVGTAEEESCFLAPADIRQNVPGTYRRLGLNLRTEAGEVLVRAAGEPLAGRAELRLLVQRGTGMPVETDSARIAPVTVSVTAGSGGAGESAYDIAVRHGYGGTEEEWLLSLKGADGATGAAGERGTDGADGADGDSAYDIAVKNGYTGTEAEWLLSLKGADGADGSGSAGGVSEQWVLDTLFPVGSLWLSVDSTGPAERFGGTWTRIRDRFLLGAGDVYAPGATGGAAQVCLTAEQNAPHTHTADEFGVLPNYTTDPDAGRAALRSVHYTGTSSVVTKGSGVTASSGTGAAHENMPPYEAVYMWKRIA